jgi:hypothetical protein
MIKIENVEVVGWEHAIRGMRNPYDSWDKSDSCSAETWEQFNNSLQGFDALNHLPKENPSQDNKPLLDFHVGDNDLSLMKKLAKAGTDHRKFMRMITVYADITAPMYWWKEADTYKVGTVRNSCSTMHCITNKEFTIDDFSHEHLEDNDLGFDYGGMYDCDSMTMLDFIISGLNYYRTQYLETKDKDYWWKIIQLLPSSYNQRSTFMLNYEVLSNIYKSRRNHKLTEWQTFCEWIENDLPYSELITGKEV